MFKCKVYVVLPLRHISDTDSEVPGAFGVAEYDFDPGIFPGEQVRVRDASLFNRTVNGEPVETGEPKFSFMAQVVSRQKVIKSGVPKDNFTLEIKLEIADKENIPEMVNLLKSKYPEQLVDYPLTELDKELN